MNFSPSVFGKGSQSLDSIAEITKASQFYPKSFQLNCLFGASAGFITDRWVAVSVTDGSLSVFSP